MSYSPGIEANRPFGIVPRFQRSQPTLKGRAIFGFAFGRTCIQVATALLLVLTAASLEAAAANDWLVDAWRVEEGLPDNAVEAIAQTPDG